MTPTESTALRQQGLEALRRADYVAAMVALRRVVQERPEDADALVLLGVACSQSGDHAGALQALEAAARLTPDAANVHYNRGLALERSGALAEALQSFQEALRLEPNHAPARQRQAALQRAAPADPNLAMAGAVEQALGSVRHNLVICPRCRAHTRRGLRCERCHADLPPELRAEPLDPLRIDLPAPAAGERIGGLTATALTAETLDLSDGGVTGVAAGWVGLVCVLAGAVLMTLGLQGPAPERIGGALFLLVVAVAALRYFAQVNRRIRVDGRLRRVEVSQLLGLTRFAVRAEQADAVHFAVALPDRENRELCWLQLATPDGRPLLRLGGLPAAEAEAARLLALGVHLARVLRLPVRVDSYPREASRQLRDALGRLG
jgi:hypothetical protein